MHIKVPFDRSLNPFGPDSIRIAQCFRPPQGFERAWRRS
jgi:hypothetical protein